MLLVLIVVLIIVIMIDLILLHFYVIDRIEVVKIAFNHIIMIVIIDWYACLHDVLLCVTV